MVNSYSLK